MAHKSSLPSQWQGSNKLPTTTTDAHRW
jgi:hypothetical protein